MSAPAANQTPRSIRRQEPGIRPERQDLAAPVAAAPVAPPAGRLLGQTGQQPAAQMRQGVLSHPGLAAQEPLPQRQPAPAPHQPAPHTPTPQQAAAHQPAPQQPQAQAPQPEMGRRSSSSSEPDWWEVAPAEVLALEFPWTAVGRRGLQPEAVNDFRRWVAQCLERAGSEATAMRTEIDRLHEYIRQQWDQAGSEAGARKAAPGSIAAAMDMVARAQAVADERTAAAQTRLTQLQQQLVETEERVGQAQKQIMTAREQARRAVAEADALIDQRWSRAEAEIGARLEQAEQEAETIVNRACEEYEALLNRLHRRAGQAAERAIAEVSAAPVRTRPFDPLRDPLPAQESADDHAVPAAEQAAAAYLATFERMGQAAVRATVDVARAERERLRPEGGPDEFGQQQLAAHGDALPVEELLVARAGGAVSGVLRPAAFAHPDQEFGQRARHSRADALRAT